MGHDISGYNKAGEEIAYARFVLVWGIIMLPYCIIYLMQIITMQELVDRAIFLPSRYNKLKRL
ncbi:hypothetical protein [Bacillus salipaludis]|uniref:Uncharacterized protein n=1 Tax=Bacillus salipaludis TaxID=2547811 RepID=A0ABW8RKG7_9BACI